MLRVRRYLDGIWGNLICTRMYEYLNLQLSLYKFRSRGDVVVKALGYKPEGRVFETR
jgi:hypothetical protein